MRKLTVLMTGAASHGFTSIVQALKNNKKYDIVVIGCDFSITPAMQYYSDKVFLLPNNEEADYSGFIIDLCVREGVEVVIPTLMDDQIPLCRNLSSFREANIEPILVSTDPQLLETILNRRLLLDYLGQILDIEIPKYEVVQTSEALRTAVETLGYPSKSVVINTSDSNNFGGLRILNGRMDQRRMFFAEKPTNLYSSPDLVLEEIGSEFPELLVMQHLPGHEYTVDILCRKGNMFTAIPWRRLMVKDGITTDAILLKDANYETLLNESQKITEGLGLSYTCGIQLKENDEGLPVVFGINTWLQDTTILSISAGVNIPVRLVEMALMEYDYDIHYDLKWGSHIQRVWQEVFSLEGRTWTYDK